jgi:beta-xylosidase
VTVTFSPQPWTNPVWPGYCADPHVIRHEGIYYAYGTHFHVAETPGIFVPSPSEKRFVVLRSRDLVSWEYLGGALEPLPDEPSPEYWAPEVTFAHGKFWMYYSCPHPSGDGTQQRLRVAVADSPKGPFRDCGKILFPDEGFTIDASPFRDPKTGQWYLYFAKDYLEDRAGTGTAVAPLADDMVTISGAVQPVAVPSADWQISWRNNRMYGRVFAEWHTVEGAHVVYRDGRYYCFYSGGNWQDESYGVAYAVADHPLGPWEDMGTQRGACVLKGQGKTLGPGHNSVVLGLDDKTLLCAYHAWDNTRTARQLCLDAIDWTAEGPRVTPGYRDC